MEWVKGGASPNPLGRKLQRNSIRAAVERFLRKNISIKALQTLHDSLDARGKQELLLNLLPYAIAKQTPSSEIDKYTDEQVKDIIAELKKRQHG